MSVQFEKAELDDVVKLIEVQTLSFYHDFITYGECPFYQESVEAMERHITDCSTYKIVFESRIIGNISVRKVDDSKYYLDVLSIIPEFQNRKIGQKAIHFLEQQLKINEKKKVFEIELNTPFDNYRNHHFYEKLGFRKIDQYRHSDVLELYKYGKTIIS